MSDVKTQVQISPQISVGNILNVIPHYSSWLGLPIYIYIYIFGFRKMQGCLVAKYYQRRLCYICSIVKCLVCHGCNFQVDSSCSNFNTILSKSCSLPKFSFSLYIKSCFSHYDVTHKENASQILLQVSNMSIDLHITMLSVADFTNMIELFGSNL